MAISTAEKRRLLDAGSVRSDEVRARLQEYLDRTGLTFADFARRINYSRAAMYQFLRDQYQKISANEGPICDAICSFIDQHPVAPRTETKGALYETANVAAWRSIFYEALDKQRACVVYGGPGIQKTYPVESLIAELNRNDIAKNGEGRRAYYVYCPQSVRPTDLLKRVAEACGSSPTGGRDRILRNLRFDFGSRKILIVFDEAQHLDVDCLETLRELLDRLRCGLIFSGSHGLMRTFKKSIELEQWNSRLRVAVELPGMTDQDARAIVRGEMGTLREKTLADMIAKATISDPHSKEGRKYISARRLFFGMAAIKEAEERRVQ